MKKYNWIIVLLVCTIFCLSCDNGELTPKENLEIKTVCPENINSNGALLKAEVLGVGKSPLEAIGFVYWNPKLFDRELNDFFDTTTLTPFDIFKILELESNFLGTVGKDVMIEKEDKELFLGTVGGGINSPAQVFIGTVGNDVRFPGEIMSGLAESMKIINNQKSGEFSSTVKKMNAETRYQVRAYAKNNEGVSYAKANQLITD
jgi:hypothetical protein